MPTLIVASRSVPLRSGATPPRIVVYENSLCAAASAAGWSVVRCDADTLPSAAEEPVAYVSCELAMAAARSLDLALLEPPLALLARVPDRFLHRTVEFATFADLELLKGPTFVKPADPLDKWFDTGVYSDVRDIRTRGRGSPDAPVLLSEPVEWIAEYRYFVQERQVVAGSPYLALSRPMGRPFDPNRPTAMPSAGLRLVADLCDAMRDELPPALVVDVGVTEDRGWAVVEFNPVWCAGLLGADPRAVLPVLRRASRLRGALSQDDSRWVLRDPHANKKG